MRPMPPFSTQCDSSWKTRAGNRWYRNWRRNSWNLWSVTRAKCLSLASTALRKAAGVWYVPWVAIGDLHCQSRNVVADSER